jgi:hypothetical protein
MKKSHAPALRCWKNSDLNALERVLVRGAKPRAKKKIVKCPEIMEHF